MKSQLEISIVIATCNRSESLKDVLDSLLNQEISSNADWELIIVDNNSKDNTKELVESYIPKFQGKMRYLFEPKQGQSVARNTGIKSANGKIIAFTDDDVIVDKKWLFHIKKFSDEHQFDAMGGRILPLYPQRTPRWIKDNKDLLDGPIVLHDYGKDSKPYVNPMYAFVGANLIVKRELFDIYGLFRTDLGPGAGTFGDDTYFFLKWKRAGRILYYCGEALVWHKVERNRMSLAYIASWNIRSGRFYVLTGERGLPEENVVYWFGVPRYMIREIIKKQGIAVIVNIFNRRSFLKAWVNFFRELGILLELKEARRKCQHLQ
jgi:glycosyltransferase involved in cell wall biosynthesis